MTITDLQKGQSATIEKVEGDGIQRQHLLDMGVTPGEDIRYLGTAPMGDPLKIMVRGYSLSLMKKEAAHISVTPIESKEQVRDSEEHIDFGYNLTLHEHNSHPGYGEEGKYHSHKEESKALPKDSPLSLAIVGQKNSGSTSLFNKLTGSSRHVGNFPGTTVDMGNASLSDKPNTSLSDLPGLYSLTPYTSQEKLTRDFLLENRPNAIINIVDANNIERNFYLTLQLMELGIPVVVALNMMDEVRGNGGNIRINRMESILGLPVVPIIAERGEGVDELLSHALHIARYNETPVLQDFCDSSDHGGAVHRCIHSIELLVEERAASAGLPSKFAAEKLVEGDSLVKNSLKLTEKEEQTIERIVADMEAERGLDRAAAIADMRYNFIRKLCNETVIKPSESKEYRRSNKMDRILTGKWTAIPIFLLVMISLLYLTIDVFGSPLQNLLDEGITGLGAVIGKGLEAARVSPAIISLVVDAIFGGVGSVVSFVPIIIILFFFLSILEDSGYMARVAFVTDKVLRRLGLSGRSIVPLLIGFGCSVPAVMASRTLPSSSDRKLTIRLIPFMSCSAKIPIYAFFSAAFFPGRGGLVLVCLYLLAIFIGIIFALAYKYIGKRTEPAPFVMELPNYRLPKARNVAHLLWDKTKDFLQNAFTVIFLATIVIWFLQSFDMRFHLVENGEGSILYHIAGWIAPVFKPIGLDDWRIVTALISGFLAKETVVSTMEVLGAGAFLTGASAIAMLVFCLLYTPCIAAITAVRRELGLRRALEMILFQCSLAWLVAWISFILIS